MNKNIEKLSFIFEGLRKAHGYFKPDLSSKGKVRGNSYKVDSPLTKKIWEDHLSGKGYVVGVYLVNEESNCKWGCIDIDVYEDLNYKQLIQDIRRHKFPLVVCRSKSSGAHCFLFSKDWLPAKDMKKTLSSMKSILGLSGSEIFPKTTTIKEDGFGSRLNIPYYNSFCSLQYAFDEEGKAVGLEEFFELYDKYVQEPDYISTFKPKESQGEKLFPQGPPCLQTIFAYGKKTDNSLRNNVLFHMGVYFLKAKPEVWEEKLAEYNQTCFDSPYDQKAFNSIVNSLKKKKYHYLCTQDPMASVCNKELCYLRKFGVGLDNAMPDLANLRKFDSDPPLWSLEFNGVSIKDITTEQLMNQTKLRETCLNQTNFMMVRVSGYIFDKTIKKLVDDMQDHPEETIIVAPEDTSKEYRFIELLKDFCLHFRQSKDMLAIEHTSNVYTDEETQMVYFKLSSLQEFLEKRNFKDYDRPRLGKKLKELGGNNKKMWISKVQKSIWTYELPLSSITGESAQNLPSPEPSKEPF